MTVVARYSCGLCSPQRPCAACREATKRANGEPEDRGNEWDEWVRQRQDETGAFNPASSASRDRK